MKKLLPLFAISLFLISCEKEDTKVADNSSEASIVGNWGPWEIKEYNIYHSTNDTLSSTSMWGDSKIEFKSDNTIIHTNSGNYNASGNYLITGKGIKISLSNGVQNINGNPLNVLNPNPYSGNIDTLNSNRIVFSDSINTGSYLRIKIYSANRIK